MLMLWAAFGTEWTVNHKVTFDGVNRLIIVQPDVTELDILVDVYSDWKEWTELYDNAKYVQAMRTSGGDPVGGGLTLGTVFFLINNWKLQYDPTKVKVSGVLLSDDFDTAYYLYDGQPVYPATVSNIVNTITVPENIVTGDIADVANAVWNALMANYVTPGTTGEALSAAGSGGVSPSAIAGAVWNAARASYVVPGSFGETNQVLALTGPQTSAAVWNAATASYNVAGTFGEKNQNLALTGPQTAAAVWNADTLTYNTGGTFGAVSQIVPLSVQQTEDAVWDAARAAHTDVGSFGETSQTNGITPQQVQDAVWDAARAAHTTVGTFGETNQTSTNGPTAAEIADAVWDEPTNDHLALGTTGYTAAQTKADTASIIISQGAATSLIQTLLKYEMNRTKIDTQAKTLTIYDDDCTTPLQVFDLIDSFGNPSITEVCERKPTSCP